MVAFGSVAETAGAAPSSGGVLNHFTPLYMGGPATYTETQAVALAEQFDVIAEKGGTFAPYVAAMHLTNPSLRIVAYLNAGFDTSRGGTAYPATWYAHDRDGSRIRAVASGNWLMDPTNPMWAPTVAGLCSAAIARGHDDGCFLDTLGLGPLVPSYVTGLPIDPKTGQVYTDATWIAARANTPAAVAKVARVTIANGLANGTLFSYTSPLLATSHLAMAETWLRAPGSPATAFPSIATWLAGVNMVADAESHGWGVMTVTKLWTDATPAQVTQWHKFTIASFLMGADGHSAYSFTPAKTPAGMTTMNSYDHVAIGTPIGTYALQGGVYQRSFSHGLAVVNPGTSPVTIVLGTTYTNLNGDVVTRETLAPDTGDVLVLSTHASGMTWSFDDSVQNWTGSNAQLALSTAQPYRGTHSLRLTVTANGGAYAVSQHPFAATAISPSEIVSLAMYLRAGSHVRWTQAIIDWYTATGSLISQTLGPSARSSTSTWTDDSVSGFAPPTAASYAAEIYLGNGSLAGEASYIGLVNCTVS